MSDDIILQEIADNIPEFQLKVFDTENSYEAFKNILVQKIRELINTNFADLVNILYRIDISEKKLKEQLQNDNPDSAGLIADMIIQRQVQKIETRTLFKNHQDIPENEKW